MTATRRKFLFMKHISHEPIPITAGTLAERAWACQERVLSPRILHYTTDQIFWECRYRFLTKDRVQLESNCDRRVLTAPSMARRLTFREILFKRISIWYHDLISVLYSARILTRLTDPFQSKFSPSWSWTTYETQVSWPMCVYD